MGFGLCPGVAFAVFFALVGGNMNNGTNDGLWYWNCNNASSNTNWNIGARLLILYKFITHHLPQHLLEISRYGLC